MADTISPSAPLSQLFHGRSLQYNHCSSHRRAGMIFSMTTAAKGTFAFVSLGCPKNTVDSERMLGKLAQDGYALTPDADGADVVVVNTCGFIEPARQDALGVIRDVADLQKHGRIGAEAGPG